MLLAHGAMVWLFTHPKKGLRVVDANCKQMPSLQVAMGKIIGTLLWLLEFKRNRNPYPNKGNKLAPLGSRE